MTIGQTFVVNSELVQNCGLQVMDIYLVLCHAIAQIVAAAVNNTTLDAGAGEP